MSGVCLRNFNWGNALAEMFGVLTEGSDVFLLKIAPAGEETSIWQIVLRLGPSFSFFLSFFPSFFLSLSFLFILRPRKEALRIVRTPTPFGSTLYLLILDTPSCLYYWNSTKLIFLLKSEFNFLNVTRFFRNVNQISF